MSHGLFLMNIILYHFLGTYLLCAIISDITHGKSFLPTVGEP